jgi:hypothetical protein
VDKTTFVIEPGIGAGPVILGKHRDAIQAAYTYVYSSFFKAQTSKFRSDQCELAGFIAHYDLTGNTKHIEIFNGEHQVIEYEIFGIKAKNITLSKLKKHLSLKGIPFEMHFQLSAKRITTGSNRSLRSLGRAKARPLTKRYKPKA